MRLEHIYNHIELQGELADIITQSFKNFYKDGLDNISSHRVQARLAILKDDWERFSLEHKAITIAANELRNEDRVELLAHSYFSHNLFLNTHERYVEATERLNSLIDHDRTSTASQSAPLSSSVLPVYYHHARLPRIDLPKFNGTPSDWLCFKDLFNSLVITNPSLSAVEKLQYLKTSLTGSAAALLKNTMLSSDNFQKAWDALVSFYENKRLLVNAALHSLLTLKRMTRESAMELERLYTGLMQIYRTLDTLQRPVQNWDDFLVFVTAFEKSRMLKPTSQGSAQAAKSHLHAKPARGSTTGTTSSCPICKAKHFVWACPQYTNKSTDQRIEIIKKHQLCFNCLGSHRSVNCKSNRRCQNCAAKHHTTIHQAHRTKSSNKPETKKDTDKQTDVQVLHSSVEHTDNIPNVLLATACVKVIASTGMLSKARVLIDQGSEISLVTERLVQRLRLTRRQSHIPLLGIGVQGPVQTKGLVSITFTPHFESEFECTVSAHILPKLTTALPSVRIKSQTWEHLDGLRLADPNFQTPNPIDMILGADVYGQLIEEGVIKGSSTSPIAQRTRLGWIVSGPINPATAVTVLHGYHVVANNDLYELIRRFWTLEECPHVNNRTLSTDEQSCEDIFKSTHSRDTDGRYVVKLPFKEASKVLGDSRAKAIRMVKRLTHQFNNNPDYARHYSDFMEEYSRLKHMHLVTAELSTPSEVYYLPHHGVWKEQSVTTKLRVVFNGSSPTTSGYSLNDILHTGVKLQTEIFDVLVGFRRFRYVFSTDVEKMFRQVKIHPDHWSFQRIIWMDSIEGLLTYELNTVTYGLVCAPYLSLRVFQQLIEDEGARYPLAVPILKNGRYVDDIFGGADSMEQACEAATQLDRLCTAGGFNLQKWTSNEVSILQPIPLKKQFSGTAIKIDDNLVVHALGLCWQPASDTFQFSTKITASKVTTKRIILSNIAKLFDPLGFLSPVIISAKILMQELWSIQLSWDDPLPEPMTNKWHQFLDSLQDLNRITISRWVNYKSDYEIELHGFCDASQHAIAATVYMRSVNERGEVTVRILASKTKVAPLKRLTIPRLELSGAGLLTKLVVQLTKTLELGKAPIYMWTDSSIVLTWLTGNPSRWKHFVHNRVCYIQDTLPQASWRFIRGSENPADLATRGITPSLLAEQKDWWQGPVWLVQPFTEWPSIVSASPQQGLLEERPAKIHATRSSSEVWDLARKFSSLTKLLRITAQCRRAVAKFKRVTTTYTVPISTTELEEARIFWIKTIQQSYFHNELNLLRNNTSLPSSNSLLRLTPFLDSYGLLRVGGRLQHSLLALPAKHPLILPKESPLTHLIIADAHLRTLHGGTQVTLTYIRNDYWIIGGRNPVRSHILKCVRCTRFRQKRAQQLIGQLPSQRITPFRPFLHAGVDYAGPFLIKTWREKNARSYKAYIALFVCFSTSAVHLKLVTDYTTDAFLAAFKRFTARRGICSTLTSECGTNFKGADVELRRLFATSSQESEKLAILLAKDGEPNGNLTHQPLRILAVEAVLNSRPLSALTEDPDDLQVLTPRHFLMDCAPTTIPEPSLEHLNVSRMSRWQLIRKMTEGFWTRWSTECLQRYHAMYKWNRPSPSLKPGTLVLVVDERYPPSKWPLGRILQTHSGADDLTRVVTIRTQNAILKRSIHKICPLPVQQDSL